MDINLNYEKKYLVLKGGSSFSLFTAKPTVVKILDDNYLKSILLKIIIQTMNMFEQIIIGYTSNIDLDIDKLNEIKTKNVLFNNNINVNNMATIFSQWAISLRGSFKHFTSKFVRDVFYDLLKDQINRTVFEEIMKDKQFNKKIKVHEQQIMELEKHIKLEILKINDKISFLKKEIKELKKNTIQYADETVKSKIKNMNKDIDIDEAIKNAIINEIMNHMYIEHALKFIL